MKNHKRLLSLLLVIVLLATVISGCGSRDKAKEGEGSSSSVSSSAPRNPAKPGEKAISSVLPGMVKYVLEKKELNSETVGWLQIGHLGIDDVIVCDTQSNMTYYRANFEKQYDFDGVFYADKRSAFGDGSPEQLGVNTCIYGHSLTDDKEHNKYNVKFGPIHGFKDPEVAKEIPYIFFSTEKEDLAFEVFAVFVANVDNADVPYNRNDIEPAEFRKMVKEQILPRSIYNYDVELKDDDKFLTLSTCIYTLPNGTYVGYPNNYRYAIMGRLVNPDDALKTEASFTINENPIVDPAESMAS